MGEEEEEGRGRKIEGTEARHTDTYTKKASQCNVKTTVTRRKRQRKGERSSLSKSKEEGRREKHVKGRMTRTQSTYIYVQVSATFSHTHTATTHTIPSQMKRRTQRGCGTCCLIATHLIRHQHEGCSATANVGKRRNLKNKRSRKLTYE